MTFTLIGALLYTFNWISTSVCQFHRVVVQPGEEATLRCSNLSRFPMFLHWFKLADGPNPDVIVSMENSEWSSSDKLQLGRFTMTSNIADLFLHIKSVDFSDTGLYFCGSRAAENAVIFSATYFQVKDASNEATNVPAVILGAVTFCLAIVVIWLAAKVWLFQREQAYTQNQTQNENLNPDNLNYAAPSFRPKAERNRRPVAEREPKTAVLYAATR